MVDWYGVFWWVKHVARDIVPYFAQTACVGYSIILAIKFVLFLLGWGKRNG